MWGLVVVAANTLQAQGIDSTALQSLQNAAANSQSQALLVYYQNQPVCENYFGGSPRKFDLRFITPSVASLAIAHLLSSGKLPDWNVPLSKYFPAFNTPEKQAITLDLLLKHQTGLQAVSYEDADFAQAPDYVEAALQAPVARTPGTYFSYNNKTLQLLAALVLQISGQPIDQYLQQHLFSKLAIDATWQHDQVGQVVVYTGLQMTATDLAKIGQLILQKGEWNGQSLIAPIWIEALMENHPNDYLPYGMLWWLIPAKTRLIVDEPQLKQLATAGANADFLEKAKGVMGVYENQKTYIEALVAVFGQNYMQTLSAELSPLGLHLSRKVFDDIIGYKADGYTGQYLIVYPQQQLVAVRLLDSPPNYQADLHKMVNFEIMVQALLKINR